MDSSLPISCFQGQQKLQRQHIHLSPEGCQCFAWFESLTSPYGQRSLSMGRLPREFSRAVLEGKMMPEIWQGWERVIPRKPAWLYHTHKKNNNMDGKIRVGNKERSAVTTSTAQKRARGTGMETNYWDLCRGKRGLGTSEKGETQWKSPAALSVVLVLRSRWHCGIPVAHCVLELTWE